MYYIKQHINNKLACDLVNIEVQPKICVAYKKTYDVFM